MLARLYVARDRDAAGRIAAERLNARGSVAGIEVRDLVPRWADFTEDLRHLGLDRLRAHLGGQFAPSDVLAVPIVGRPWYLRFRPQALR